MRIHKYAACGFFIVGMVHFSLVIKVIDTRNIIVVISGIVILITGIALTFVCHRMKNRKKAESILKTMIARQSVAVDAISGATNSSMVIEKACVNALTK